MFDTAGDGDWGDSQFCSPYLLRFIVAYAELLRRLGSLGLASSAADVISLASLNSSSTIDSM